MDKPLVSIIVPVYNSERYLCDSINSILEQTYKNREIIVVDDGSTDGSLALLKDYSGAIRVITQENQGQGVARNRGVRECKGDLLAFLDSDDIWDTDKICKQVDIFNTYPEAVAVYCDYRIIDDNGSVTQRTSALGTMRPSGFILPQLLSGNCVGSPSVVMVRKEAFIQAGGFNETSSKAAEDYTLWLALSAVGPFIYECATRVSYRRHQTQTSVSSEFALKRASGNLNALMRIKHIVPTLNNELAHLYNQKIWKAAITLNWSARKANNRSYAIRACVELIKMRPWRFDILILLFRSL